MLSNNTYINLDCISKIKDGEFLQCDEHGNVLSYLEHSFHNHSPPKVFNNNWVLCIKGLQQIYINELPLLIETTIQNQDTIEIDLLYKMIKYSMKGLETLSQSYFNKKTDKASYIDAIINDYVDDQLILLMNSVVV